MPFLDEVLPEPVSMYCTLCVAPVLGLTWTMKMPAVPFLLFRPLPKITPQVPSCRRRIDGVP